MKAAFQARFYDFFVEKAVVVFEFNCGRSLNVVLTMGFQFSYFSVDIVDVPLV
tara:strand:+ start:73 stop:231 length:159 start_codon:yes stop_codon:yes gene_type:complete